MSKASRLLNLSLSRRGYVSPMNLQLYGKPSVTLSERYKAAREYHKQNPDTNLSLLYEICLRRHVRDLQKAYPEHRRELSYLLRSQRSKVKILDGLKE